MAGGPNETRAMQIARVMNDYRTIQILIAQFRANPPTGQAQELGYDMLRQCHTEAQAVLNAHFDSGSLDVPVSLDESTRRQLQRILLDATARRFRVRCIYSKAAAAMRWVARRDQILQGQPPASEQAAALRQLDDILRAEVAAATEERAFNELHARDVQAGTWTTEMPTLDALLSFIQNH